jgi:hypothetical protein
MDENRSNKALQQVMARFPTSANDRDPIQTLLETAESVVLKRYMALRFTIEIMQRGISEAELQAGLHEMWDELTDAERDMLSKRGHGL